MFFWMLDNHTMILEVTLDKKFVLIVINTSFHPLLCVDKLWMCWWRLCWRTLRFLTLPIHHLIHCWWRHMNLSNKYERIQQSYILFVAFSLLQHEVGLHSLLIWPCFMQEFDIVHTTCLLSDSCTCQSFDLLVVDLLKGLLVPHISSQSLVMP
jgi:hypothetical protein